MISLYEIPRIGTFIETNKKYNKGHQGLGEEGMGSYCFMDTELLFGMMKKFWK